MSNPHTRKLYGKIRVDNFDNEKEFEEMLSLYRTNASTIKVINYGKVRGEDVWFIKFMLKPARGKRSNPSPSFSSSLPKGAVEIYDNVLAIEAKKGKSSQWPGEKFRHDFKKSQGKAKVYGLSDGSILIKGNKRLWKNFNY